MLIRLAAGLDAAPWTGAGCNVVRINDAGRAGQKAGMDVRFN
jgi:hypothetical protein